MPVAEQGVLWRKYNAMGIELAQLPLFSVSLEIMAFNVRCSLSTTPFPCGWYGEAVGGTGRKTHVGYPGCRPIS